MIKRFVTRPLFTLAIFTVILLMGVYGYIQLPLDLFPNFSIPTLTIITPYPGAGPDDIETTVSKVIEDSVATVSNIDRITSDSIENLSTVTIQFKWGTNLDAASADVRDKMDLVRSKLPKDVQPSTIYKFDMSQIPVLIIGLSADESYKNLYHIADKQISNSLKRIAGVGTVSIAGGLQRQINVDVDKERLEAYHLSMSQINMALQAANLTLPAGSFKQGQLEYGVRVPGEYKDVSQIPRTIVGSFGGKDIYLSDVATVTDSFKDPDSITEVNSKPGVQMIVQKQSGANSVKIADEVRKQFEIIKNEIPQDIKITYVQDTSEFIKNSLEDLTQTLMWALLFVLLTVLFFLRNFRGALIVGAAIPFSIISAFIFMFFTGGSINIISMASIVISIGVVVDDAIVVLENIYRHRDKKGEAPKEAAIYGGGEVIGAVLAATTTNLVIFLPLLLVQGFVGIFFNQLSLLTIVIIAMSFVTSISLTPMLSSKLLAEKGSADKKRKNLMSGFYEKSEAIFQLLENNYKKILEWSLARTKLIIISGTVFFFISMPLFMFTGSEFFPNMNSGMLTANVALPAGVKIEETASYMRTLQDKLRKEIKEIEFILVTAGTSTRMSMSTKNGPNYGKLYIKLVPKNKRNRSDEAVQRNVASIAWSIPGLKSIDFQQGGANAMATSGRPIQVEIYGQDFEDLDTIAPVVRENIKSIPGIVDPMISREKSNPEYQLEIDRSKTSNLGLSMYDVAMAARSYIYGTQVTKYRELGDEYDIFTRLKLSDRKSLEDVKSVFVTTRTGKNVTLGNLASIKLENAPQIIQRKNQQRYVIVDADNYGRSLGDVTNDIMKKIEIISIPEDVQIKMGGNTQQMAESFKSLFISLMLAIALIYLVMVAQFESFIDPLIIMFAIPFALAGVVWSLFLTGYPFGIMAFVGIILVTGIAVKNTIVLVDYINILRERGIELKEAILEAGRTRLRPILMTSSSTMLGLFPIIFGTNEGTNFWKAMSLSVCGGLLVSLAISLVFVPSVYYVMEGRALRKKGTK